MKRVLALLFVLSVVYVLHAAQDSDDRKKSREALQELNDYIGGWNGNGTTEKSKLDIWKEKADWSWRFKGDDAWLVLKLDGGKHYKGGELRYQPDKELYQMTMTDKDGAKHVFTGKLKKGKLILERQDPETKATQQIAMNMAGGGIRFIYAYSVKPADRTFYAKEFQVGFTKEGEAFGATEKKIECIVTGGLGKIAVTYKNITYYVCCSGCRDAFNENPEKYVREAAAKKKD
jgi:hypothetical protein